MISRLGLHQGRIQQAGLAEAVQAAVLLKGELVQLPHSRGRKENGLSHIPRGAVVTPRLLSQFAQELFTLGEDLVGDALESRVIG